MSDAILGYDSEFATGSAASPPVYTDFLEVTEISFPNIQADDVEVTHMKSPGKFREYIAGFKEGGECAVTCNWIDDNATDITIRTLHASGAMTPMRITTPRGVTYAFDGYIKGVERASPIDDRRTITATVKVASQVVVAVPSPLEAIP